MLKCRASGRNVYMDTILLIQFSISFIFIIYISCDGSLSRRPPVPAVAGLEEVMQVMNVLSTVAAGTRKGGHLG